MVIVQGGAFFCGSATRVGKNNRENQLWIFFTAALGCERNRELIPECFLFAESMW
jgi:hypothetical protein